MLLGRFTTRLSSVLVSVSFRTFQVLADVLLLVVSPCKFATDLVAGIPGSIELFGLKLALKILTPESKTHPPLLGN